VLSDVRMAEMDGLALPRDPQPLASTMVAIMTAYATVGTRST
jgi:DNA-binding NtrC family response regulator